ncbi:Serine/threonine-protein phosphatase 2A 56 kDa regulatory subunit delta 2 isoform [Frankliniella fusca]|uniref:Serine/threonine-protein phosphatase 2A 56 kDa regulatory subunit delta 2 isoform n=1 Tax=Frankliniella fusca TaxID=407009 RepID=A0AAE1HZK4_9NEOP|nr:Serine/threonine-protein phosphatase 2A 56 kDa regulatory subunit delta 2 isoform [Frankliniella fusca]
MIFYINVRSEDGAALRANVKCICNMEDAIDMPASFCTLPGPNAAESPEAFQLLIPRKTHSFPVPACCPAVSSGEEADGRVTGDLACRGGCANIIVLVKSYRPPGGSLGAGEREFGSDRVGSDPFRLALLPSTPQYCTAQPPPGQDGQKFKVTNDIAERMRPVSRKLRPPALILGAE